MSDLEHEIARQRCRQRGEIGRDRGCRVEPRIKDIADGGDAECDNRLRCGQKETDREAASLPVTPALPRRR
jgi:hypothetical protein